MITMCDTEYLHFSEISDPAMKTRTWQVSSVSSGASLGIIKFYSPWRQFVFAPSNGCLFNAGCMKDLTAVCLKATEDWKVTLAERKQPDIWT